jgi:beta-mannosidase
VAETERTVELGPHSGCEHNVEELLGRFVDASWSYRPSQDLTVVSLERQGEQGNELMSQSFRLPAGRPTTREPGARLGLLAHLHALSDSSARVIASSRRFAYGVRVDLPGFVAHDDAFSVEPGREREVALTRVEDGPALSAGNLTAINLSGRVGIAAEAVG